MLLLALLACSDAPVTDTAPDTRAWSRVVPPLRGDEVEGWRPARSIIHLHSPWSHDACDGDPQPNGEPNAPCLVDFRAALCDAGLDAAFVTDHPTHAAFQEYEELMWVQEGDTPVSVDGAVVANRLGCAGEAAPLLLPGIEDTLMPVALRRHVEGEAEARDATYNERDEASFSALAQTGGVVALAHTEQEPIEELYRLQDLGLQAVEAFNLHAMVDPDIRGDFLGLDPWAWTTAIAPFTDSSSEAEPDLLFLAFFQEQQPSLASWDALNARGPMLGTAGTDAHQNVLPLELRDGERVDSYRRMIRWFSNWVLLPAGQDPEPQALTEALQQGRSLIVFEVLGTPSGVGLSWESDGQELPPGSDVGPGTLNIRCPELSLDSPRGEEQPEIQALVLKDGVQVAEGCGQHSLSEPGVYRVVFTIVPHHLRPFLGEVPELADQSWAWIYGNPWRLQD